MDVDWLIAEASRQGKTFEAASAQEQNGHQHGNFESQHPASRVEHTSRFASSSGSSAFESQIQRAAENDNQLATVISPLANLF